MGRSTKIHGMIVPEPVRTLCPGGLGQAILHEKRIAVYFGKVDRRKRDQQIGTARKPDRSSAKGYLTNGITVECKDAQETEEPQDPLDLWLFPAHACSYWMFADAGSLAGEHQALHHTHTG